MDLNLSGWCVLCKSLCHLLDAATTLYLELFQTNVLLGAILNYCSIICIRSLYSELSGQVSSLHRRNLYDELFYHLHNRENSLVHQLPRITLTAVLGAILGSLLYPLTDSWQGTLQVRYTTQHTVEPTSKAQGTTFVLSLSSAVVRS